MGLLTDVFIATEAELAATRFEGSPGNFFPTVYGKNFDPPELAWLEAIVTEREQDLDTIIEMIDQPIRGDESTEEWIYLFSERLVARLAELTEASISHYGVRWAEEWLGQRAKPLTPKKSMPGWKRIWLRVWRGPGAKPLTPKDAAMHSANVTHYLQALCQLARRAQADGKRMYLWIGL
jgi:hypothetical protein